MKINLTKALMARRNIADDWISWAIIEQITAFEEANPDSVNITHNLTKQRKNKDDIIVDVSLKIEGIEMPFDKFIERLHDTFERSLLDAATDHQQERINNLTDRISKQVDQCFEDWKKEYGPKTS